MKKIITMLLFFAAGATATFAASVQVTVRAYSGRDNPTFAITDSSIIAHIQDLYAQKGALSSNSLADTPPYTGLYLVSSGTTLPSYLIVKGGVIINSDATGSISNALGLDTSNALEDYLLQMAVNSGAVTSADHDLILSVRDGEFNNRNGDPGNIFPPSED